MRHSDSLAIENDSYHLATAPLYLPLVVAHTLPGSQHIVNDDKLLSLLYPQNSVIPFKDAVLVTNGFVQTFTRLEHINII